MVLMLQNGMTLMTEMQNLVKIEKMIVTSVRGTKIYFWLVPYLHLKTPRHRRHQRHLL